MNKKTEYDKVSKRVYKLVPYKNLMNKVLEDIVYQTHLMSDEELRYDRNEFMRQTRMVLPSDEHKEVEDIHTLSILKEQIIRFGEIIYNQEKIEESKK